ncbi:protein BPS1, chloroplastic-like [Vicia villosa]|uniref:protein BPS1, chloroplastic-like n=1 Tax=Vicia villosa TaxID=3911 RepID=UPI00273BC7F8|nr:protein BPS1, chloroplastic-like [Vicia villosa]XP_058754643.1 protein BPS1, chloroplastic-like [Vicia villosa]
MSLPQDPPRSFFPFGNPFRMISPKGTKLSPQLLTVLRAFEETLEERLKKLIPKSKDEVVSLSWMISAMQALCESHNDIKTLMTDLELPVTDWNEKWVDVYLDISVKLLDVCNAFSSELSRLNKGQLLLQCTLHHLGSSSPDQLFRACSSLDSWRQHFSSKNPRIEKCGSILDDLVESSDMPKVKKSAKGTVLMQAIYGVKALTVFVCSVFATAFSGSTKNLMDMNVADHYSWAPAFKVLQNLINENIRVKFSSGRFTVLNELEAVDLSVRELYPIIQGGVVHTIETESHTKTVEKLGRETENFSEGLDLLAKEVDGFFQVVLSGRDALLANLRSVILGPDHILGVKSDAQVVN